MKKLLLALTLAVSVSISYGQGTVQFVNGLASRFNQTVIGSGVVTQIPAGTPYNFGIFWGTSADSLSLSSGPLATMSGTVGTITVASGTAYQLPGSTENTSVFLQVRAWDASFGSDWGAALAAFNSGAANVAFGQTAVIQAVLGPSTGPGTVIWQGATGTNPNRFNPLLVEINPVPEPTTIALGVLGAGSLLFLRRKK